MAGAAPPATSTTQPAINGKGKRTVVAPILAVTPGFPLTNNRRQAAGRLLHRLKDRVHILDLIGAGLIDATWPARFPGPLGERLQRLLDDPNG
jgi:hypothetical protein